jgi:hypothetical protein
VEQFLVALAAYAAGYFVGGPLLTLLHELGHALPAALLARSRVTVNQGARPSLLRFSLWRLDFRLRPLVGFRTAWFGFCESEAADVSRAKRIVISAAGPATSLLAFVMLSVLAGSLSYPASWFVWSAAVGAATQFLVTAIPLRYGRLFGPYSGRISDGRRIVELVRQALAVPQTGELSQRTASSNRGGSLSVHGRQSRHQQSGSPRGDSPDRRPPRARAPAGSGGSPARRALPEGAGTGPPGPNLSPVDPRGSGRT